MARQWIKRCWISLAAVMFIAAVLMSAVRLLAPSAHRYKAELESRLSLLVGEPVTIKRMHASWYWFEPVLKLDKVVVSHDGNKILSFRELLVGINILSSLWHWQLQPGILFIDKVHLNLHQENNHWRVDGFPQGGSYTTSLNTNSYLPLVGWLLSQQKIVIKNVSATLHLQDGTIIPVQQVALMAVNKRGHYRLKAHAALGQDEQADFSLLGDLDIPSDPFRGAMGSVFFSAKNVHLDPLHSLLSKGDYDVLKGNGDLKVWLDLNHGQVKQLQSEVHLNNAVWKRKSAEDEHKINKFNANVAFNPTKNGWQLTADHILLETPKGVWPENEASLSFIKSSQTYQVFIKTLSLLSLNTLGIEWPTAFQSVLDMKPRGQLDNSQIGFTAGEVSSFLSRFSALSFDGKDKIPRVKNLSGAFYWEPTQGRLELDGEDTTLVFTGHSPLQFNTVNVALDWKVLSEGLRLNLDRLVISHPHLLLSARGLLDGVSKESLGTLQLTGEFSTEEGQYWLPILPLHGHVKPKLEAWLTQDIKRIKEATGKFRVNGPLADFPFDEKPGDFSILTSLHGVDLAFNHEWPVTHDIDAYLRVVKRDLSADITHADLGGVVSDKINLRVDGLGLGEETLIVHGNIEAPADKMLNYVLNSPLKNHLNKLSALSLGEEAALDLGLEISLYPESDDVFVRGMLLFNNNTLTVHHVLSEFYLNHLLGMVYFDEHGVSDSLLTAAFLDEPMAIRVRSINAASPYTQIELKTELSAAVLRHQYQVPILTWLEGPIAMTSTIQLSDNPLAADHLDVEASLAGVKVNLPEPFGKTINEPAIFSLSADVNLKKDIRLKMKYADSIKANLIFLPRGKEFKLTAGEACVGCKELAAATGDGALFSANLSHVEWSAWSKALSQLPSTSASSSSWLEGFKKIKLDVGSLDALGQHLVDIKIRAKGLSQGKWSLQVMQEKLAGDLTYDDHARLVSGKIKHLAISKPKVDTSKKLETPDAFKPKDIPNFDLTFEALTLDDKALGNGVFKSTTNKNTWHVENCHIESEAYAFDAKGDWTLQGTKSETAGDATLHVKKLSSMLTLWGILPVVEAKQGDIEFKGGWSGSPGDFSLKHLTGEMGIQFKNGRITHLSTETEEKLGLGKLLSILSLQTIPRRLQLDFSDLSNGGYSFDVFNGHFDFKNGVMATNDSYIDGPVAYASMKGELDLDKQLYDLDLHVSPHITASLPVVVAIAGGPIAGPIAGIATWVASKIINQGMEKISGYTYKISGPWLEPVVQQVHIYKKKPQIEKKEIKLDEASNTPRSSS